MTAIYALTGPDGAIRYIGKANDPAARLKSHVRDARRRNTPVACWIRSLAAKGSAPAMVVLAEVAESDWPEAEALVIEAHRRAGHRLLNLAAGGAEPFCPVSVRADNGRRVAAGIHGNPKRRALWECRKVLAQELGWLEKRGTERSLVIAAKVRRALVETA